MKTITANRLTDGRVVYRTIDEGWSENATQALRLTPENAETALASALEDQLIVVDPYLIDITGDVGDFTPTGRKHVREAIRLTGPSAGSTKEIAHVSIR